MRLTKGEVLRPEMLVTYVPEWEKPFVNAQNLVGKNYLLQIIDLSGKVIYNTFGKTNPPYFTKDIPLSGIANGLNLVNLSTEKEVLSRKFVKE